MTQPAHPIFRWPGTLLWGLPLVATILIFLTYGLEGSVWWYIAIPALVAMTLLDLFTKVWLGITILSILFVYCSIGSSGVPISIFIWEPTAWMNLREIRGLEMTEFEWFHWWPFKWLIALLCFNMSIVTIRKIPFNLLTVGVWTIHTGVIVLVLGCTVYFSQKVEGDVLVSRRRVVIQQQDGGSISMVVTPGNTIRSEGRTFTITGINPNWELMSGSDRGTRAYTVTVEVNDGEQTFMRQLIAGYPEYTEDVVQTGDPSQPMARAKNVVGSALFDESLSLALEYDVQDEFLLTQSGSIYLRELNASGVPNSTWIERPIQNLPRFNDYIGNPNDVWFPGKGIESHPIKIGVSPNDPNDPIQEHINITSYLRYAFLQPKITGGGSDYYPVAWMTLRKGRVAEQSFQMFAFDKSLNTADSSLMRFEWVTSDEQLEELLSTLEPALFATVHGKQHALTITNSPEFQPIGDTGYQYKVVAIQNDLDINGEPVSLAQVELNHEENTWVRWVFDRSELNRDVVESQEHNATMFLDEDIKMSYEPGGAPITLVGGVNGGYVLVTAIQEGEPSVQEMQIGSNVQLTPEVSLALDRVESHGVSETRPTIVPARQRDPAALNTYSMVRANIATPEGEVSTWLPYHHYPFESTTESVRRFQYQPTIVQLKDGRLIELMFSRQKAPLSVPIALDTFEVDSHLGGFTGNTSSILNWRSLVKPLDGTGEILSVSVNDPKEYGGLWFFQSQWDPPDSMSPGLNYTVLGVGNRKGVFQMLFGTCLAVAGMIWAFYVKPMIKRKRQLNVQRGMTQ